MAGIGLSGAGDFSAGKIFACIIFGAIGSGAFVYGKKDGNYRPMVIGVALIAYPYFIPGTFFLYLVGIALTAALYFWRE